MSGDRLRWERDGRDWPHRALSRFVPAAGLRWHVQRGGQGPSLLLVHGTGAATHSWRGLLPLLVPGFDVIAPDLPGHGFTETPARFRLSLPGMAEALAGLLEALQVRPELVVGHSAGAAILARMCLDERIEPAALISLNGALLPLRGVPGQIFAPLARLFSASALVPRLFAWHVRHDHQVIEKLLRDTGSRLDPEGIELYARIARHPGQVAAAFAMMAQWNLEALRDDLPGLETPLVLVVGGNDRTIRPSEASRVRSLLPQARIVRLEGLGHLAHEEQPEAVAAVIRAQADAVNSRRARAAG